MSSPSSNKFIAISAALGAAGLLTCAGALIDAFLSNGSLAGFLMGMLLLAFVVTGVVIGYTWACDRCESAFNAWLDRVRGRGKPDRGDAVKPETTPSRPPMKPIVVHGARRAPNAPQRPAFRDRYVLALRGTFSLTDVFKATTGHAWHGQ